MRKVLSIRAWKLAVLASIFLALTVTTGIVFADHFSYLQKDSTVRSKSPSPGFNAVAYPWFLNSPAARPTKWWREAAVTEADEGVQNWQNAWSVLNFQEVSSIADADVEFRSAQCPGGKRACITEWLGTLVPNWEAHYWAHEIIKIDQGQTWSTQGKIDALTHEVGHWVGLHEQYNDDGDGTCTSNFLTIMNAASEPNGEACQPGVHAPQPWDIAAAQIYWGTGFTSNVFLQETTPTSRMLQVTWKDNAWAESWHERDLWYWNGAQWVWIPQASDFYAGNGNGTNTGIGYHRDAVDRTMSFCCWTVPFRDAQGNPITPMPGYYIAGTASWSWRTQQWSSFSFSQYIYVD
jgi:hypothetical protein